MKCVNGYSRAGSRMWQPAAGPCPRIGEDSVRRFQEMVVESVSRPHN